MVILRATAILCLASVMALPLSSYSSLSQDSAETQASNPPRGHVLAISIDGLNPKALKKLGDRAPRMNRLLRRGAATTNARTMYERTETLPNHTSMLTGRKILGKSGHGFTRNRLVPAPYTLEDVTDRDSASIFDRVSQAGGTTGMFATKKKFSILTRSWRDSIDYPCTSDDLGKCVTKAARTMKRHAPSFVFVHIADPDRAGHKHGFMSTAYLSAVERADRRVGQLLRAKNKSPELRGSTSVVLTADHGGQGAGHYQEDKYANYRIPFLVTGPRIEPQGLYSLNEKFKNPKRTRPSYDQKRPIRNGALANLAASILNLPRVAGSTENRDQALKVR